MATDLSMIIPRILIVSRRSVRKNKFVDFVGEYHLDLIVKYGAVPIIVPRVNGVHKLLDSFEPIHGVLLCEGEDIEPSLYEVEDSCLSKEELEEIRTHHPSDTSNDKEKDRIEFRLAKLCLERNMPYLGICRGAQVLNVACGGTLYQDIEKQVSHNLPEAQRVVHIDYGNYDGHRHLIRLVQNTPLYYWFKDSTKNGKAEILVNSYHHQGVRRLAQRFVPMAFSPDGLIEGFYDPDFYCPEEGKFVIGLQFHPERMRRQDSEEFDYEGCESVYQEFVKAVIAYQKRFDCAKSVPKPPKIDQILEKKKKRKIVVRSFSLASDLFWTSEGKSSSKTSELEAAAESFEETRPKHIGATIRNASSCMEQLRWNEEREKFTRELMVKMPVEKLADLMSFYSMMEKICSEVLERKIQDVASELGS